MSNDTHASMPRLPILKVVQEKYCSQEMTDKIILFLEEARPDLVLDLIDSTRPDYLTYGRLAPIIVYLRDEASKSITIPESRLAMIDIAFEIARRAQCWRAPSSGDLRIHGKSISNDASSHMPEFPHLKIKKKQLSSCITQEMAAVVYNEIRRTRPELIFEMSETLRRNIPPVETYKEFNKFLLELEKQNVIPPLNKSERQKAWRLIRAHIVFLSGLKWHTGRRMHVQTEPLYKDTFSVDTKTALNILSEIRKRRPTLRSKLMESLIAIVGGTIGGIVLSCLINLFKLWYAR